MNYAHQAYQIEALTDAGVRHKDIPNQDSIGIMLPGFFQRRPPLLILADGMGGYTGGQIASRLVIQAFKRKYLLSKLGETALPFLEDAVIAAHQTIIDKARKDPGSDKMGSTLVAVVLYPDHADLVNVGDSRAYLIQKDKLFQISRDQSVVAEKVRQGALTAKEARQASNRNQLTMSLSAKRTIVTPIFNSINLQNDDVILLCSDGLWTMVPEPLIQSVAANFSPPKAASMLIRLANEAGGKDNISVIIAMPKDRIGKIKNDYGDGNIELVPEE